MKTLEKIISSVKDAGKNSLKFVKENARVEIMTAGLIFGGIGVAKANPGYLIIENNLNSHSRWVNIVRHDATFPGAKDAKDGYDIPSNSPPNGYPNIYSDIITHTLWDDYRPEDSNALYNIKLIFSGSLPSTQPNWLVFDFYNNEYGDYEFNGQSVLFQSDRLPYGNVVDVRRAYNQNDGRVDLINAVVGTSGVYEPNAILNINSRILGDLNDDGIVNFKDFAELANDWQKPQGQYVGDINGEYGIPDGFVDVYDLEAFSDDWLKTLE